MSEPLTERILRDPTYQQLVAERRRLALLLSAVVLVVYFGYILVIGFAPALFARPIWTGAVTTVGIPVGLFVILLAFAITGIYVRAANRRFDGQVADLLQGISR